MNASSMPRAEYNRRRRAWRDAKAAWMRCKYPGSDRSLSLSCACERLRSMVPGRKHDPNWPLTLLARQQSRRRQVLHLLDTLRAYRAANVCGAGYYSSPAVVQRKLRAALSPIREH